VSTPRICRWTDLKAYFSILDRYKESRIAFAGGFANEVRDNFLAKLRPHRARHLASSKLNLYLCATALTTKRPLPRDVPKMRNVASQLFNDAL